MKPGQLRLLFALFISQFGSGLSLAVFPLLYLKAGMKEGVGIFNGVNYAGILLGTFVFFSIIDRVPKMKLAILGDVCRAVVLIPLIVSESMNLTLLISYALIDAVFESATANAIQAWLGTLSQEETFLKKANSYIEITSQTAAAAAPLVATILVLNFSTRTVFIVDAFTFLIGIAVLLTIREVRVTPSPGNPLRSLVDGFKTCLKNKEVMHWAFSASWFGVGLAIMNTVYLRILADRIGADDGQITFFQMAYFSGGIIGGILVARAKIHLRNLVVLSGASHAILMIACMFSADYYTFFAIAVLQKMSTLALSVSTRSLTVSAAEKAYLGRTVVFRTFFVAATSALSYAAALPTAKILSDNQMLFVGMLTFIIGGAMGKVLPKRDLALASQKN